MGYNGRMQGLQGYQGYIWSGETLERCRTLTNNPQLKR